MSYKIEPVPDCYCLLGEAPHWDIGTQNLYLVDVFGKKFLRYDFAQQKVYRCEIENEPMIASFIIPIEGTTDKFVTAIDRRIVIITWDGLSKTCKIDKDIAVTEQQDKYKNNHFNDGKCDLRGRLFTGTMNNDFVKHRTGNLYRLDESGLKLLKDDVGLSNGLVWNDAAKKFYFVDSMDFKVREYDYDIETGGIKNPKIILDIENLQKEKMRLPDGMTIDTEGFIYVAVFGGSNVLKIDPKNGKVLLDIKIPCEQVTSVAFGGPNLDILYVTTGALEGKPSPAGETFKVTGLGAKGLPMTKFKSLSIEMASQAIAILVLLSSLLLSVVADNVTISMEANIRVHNETVMSYKVEPLPDSFAELGEGPHWDIETQSLYMVDLSAGKIMRYDYKQNKMYKCQIENEHFASFIIPIEGAPNKFAVGIERRIVIVPWDGISESCKVEKTILTVEHSDSKFDNNRFNDAKCDPHGRLFGGTMAKTDYSKRTGHLYRLMKTDAHELLKPDVGISNGLAWDEKAKKFYYIDSEDYNVKEYDYDINTGAISNPKVIFDLHNLRGDNINLLPDGMTIDAEGFLYVATFNGSAIFKIDPKSGKILVEIKLPCEQITSAAFGGPNLDILYVTTAAANNKPLPNGTTYKITGLGAKGLPMTKLKLEE
ncbi:uncharacterized protein LOC129944923 [Eupeodes corollae]|uniref:uncharacterized protein LOC129944923 n=1 Tax=Eupeodes corollae TaxID=290404 RepID=UPI00248FB531|nr:uncharacterized protein LOC129944923 [Eupeodes corollae]